jgi:ferredoxin
MALETLRTLPTRPAKILDMAELAQRLPENAPGRFYVDATCIDCERCREIAPSFFARQDAGRYSYVAIQPQTSPDIEACRRAIDECPVEAIGDEAASA